MSIWNCGIPIMTDLIASCDRYNCVLARLALVQQTVNAAASEVFCELTYTSSEKINFNP